MSHGQPKSLDPQLVRIPEGHWLHSAQRTALFGMAVFFVAALGLGAGHWRSFHLSWLIAFAFFLSIALGGLFFTLIHHVARAGWSVVVRRLAENAAGVLPWMALLFVPLLFGLHDVFEWTHQDVVAADPVLSWKSGYLNEPFFVARAVVYFVAWSWLAVKFRGWSLQQDGTGDHALTRRMQWHSGYALLVFAFTVTFAAFDWLMSLAPHWFSTIFGGYFFAGSVIGIFAFLVLNVLFLQWNGFLGDAVSQEHRWDLGKLLFAFTVFWAYLAFSQFMLIWYSNLPEETGWFQPRFGGWQAVSLLLVFGHFIVPFFFLMPRTVKKNPIALFLAAKWMLFIHFVDLCWLVLPNFHEEGLGALTSRDWALLVVCYLAVACGFLAVYLRHLTGAALVPVKDPRLPESLAFENF